MPTNLALDPALLEKALEVSGERTKKAAVTKALEEYIARRQQRRLLALIGQLDWDTGYDPKAERSRPAREAGAAPAPKPARRRAAK